MARRINRFFVGDEYFQLATAAIRTHSNTSRRFESFSSTVGSRCGLLLRDPPTIEEIEVASALAQKGSIPVILTVADDWHREMRSAAAVAREVAGRVIYYPALTALILNRTMVTAEIS